jgi:hypothetical protein
MRERSAVGAWYRARRLQTVMPLHLRRIKHPSSGRRCDLSHQTLVPKEVTVNTQVATLAGNGTVVSVFG